MVIAILAFLALFIAYGVKTVGAPGKVLAEFRHPIAGNLFGAFLISILLLPIVIAPVNLMIARGLWVAGAAGMVLFAWTKETAKSRCWRRWPRRREGRFASPP
jgi:tellurite resistance protein